MFDFFQAKFKNAIKTAQHAVQEIVERDRDHIETILQNMEAIRKALDERNDEMQDLTVLCAKHNIPDTFRMLPSGVRVIQVKHF